MPDEGPGFLKRLEPALRARVVAFNLLPVRYAHPERLALLLPEVPAALWQRLRAGPRSAGRLSRLLLGRLGLDHSFCYDFTAPLRRLALLEAQALEQGARVAGLLLYAQAIRQVVARAPLQALKAEVGEAGLAFAVKRAAFLKLPLARSVPAGELAQAIRRDGLSCLAAWLAEEPRAVSARVALRFPPGSALEQPDPELAGPPGRLLLERALREGAGLWPRSSV